MSPALNVPFTMKFIISPEQGFELYSIRYITTVIPGDRFNKRGYKINYRAKEVKKDFDYLKFVKYLLIDSIFLTSIANSP